MSFVIQIFGGVDRTGLAPVSSGTERFNNTIGNKNECLAMKITHSKLSIF